MRYENGTHTVVEGSIEVKRLYAEALELVQERLIPFRCIEDSPFFKEGTIDREKQYLLTMFSDKIVSRFSEVSEQEDFERQGIRLTARINLPYVRDAKIEELEKEIVDLKTQCSYLNTKSDILECGLIRAFDALRYYEDTPWYKIAWQRFKKAANLYRGGGRLSNTGVFVVAGSFLLGALSMVTIPLLTIANPTIAATVLIVAGFLLGYTGTCLCDELLAGNELYTGGE